MTEPGHPARTTALVGLLLALLLAVASGVVTFVDTPPSSGQEPAPFLPPSVASPAPTPTVPLQTPRRGLDYPVRKVRALRADRSVLVNGRGSADLRYHRAGRNGTRLHFICTGCDTDTWLVEQPQGHVVGAGPLGDPSDVTSAIDTVDPGKASSLLVKAPPNARWMVTLTPFDAVPVHEQTFDTFGPDVVAVRARADLELSCRGALSLSTLARWPGASDYSVLQRREDDAAGTWRVAAPLGTDVLILVVSCPGRWTLTVPG